MAEPPLRVMLVDDHEVVRGGIKALLQATDDIVVTAEAGSVQEAIDEADRTRPDVVVMDVRLIDGSGIEATREIRARHPKTAVVMLTSFADDEALFASIMAGASGYVLKQVKSGELLRAAARIPSASHDVIVEHEFALYRTPPLALAMALLRLRGKRVTLSLHELDPDKFFVYHKIVAVLHYRMRSSPPVELLRIVYATMLIALRMLRYRSALWLLGFLGLSAVGLTALGFVFAWQLDSMQGFHAVMNLVLMPLWLLSGALFPTRGAPAWLQWLMRVNPVTYGVEALRRGCFPTQAGGPSLAMCLAVTLGFAVLTCGASLYVAGRRTANVSG